MNKIFGKYKKKTKTLGKFLEKNFVFCVERISYLERQRVISILTFLRADKKQLKC